MKRPVSITAGSPPSVVHFTPLDRTIQLLFKIDILRYILLIQWAFFIALPLMFTIISVTIVNEILRPALRADGIDDLTAELITNKLLTMTDHGQHGHVTVNGTRYHYVKAGTGEKVMLLLHGFPSSWYSWRYQLDEFKNDYTVVALDLKGFLGTEFNTSMRDLSAEVVSKDLHDIIQSIRPGGKVILVGHDTGSVVAWAFATLYPFDVDKLVIVNGVHPASFRKSITATQLLASIYFPFNALPLLPGLVFRRWHGSPFVKSFRAYLDPKTAPFVVAPMLRPGAVEAATKYYRWMQYEPLFRCDHDPLDIQTLILYGEPDKFIVPASAYYGYEGQVVVPGKVSIRCIPGAGHFVQEKKPAETNMVLRQFLGHTVPNADIQAN